MELESSSPEETEAAAASLAAGLQPGDVVTVSGELVASVSPAEWGDLEPYFDNAVAFVEWPEAGAGVLPSPRARVFLRHSAPERRSITIEHADTRV